MRFYKRDEEDKQNSINRCYYDAQKGRSFLALERIGDLYDEFHGDGKVLYQEGLIRLDFLGQGVKAHELFVRAYEADKNRYFAVCNAAYFALDDEEFFKWSKIALNDFPRDDDTVRTMTQITNQLKEIKLWKYHYGQAEHYRSTGQYASAAAHLELALLADKFTDEQRSEILVGRALCLRELDKAEENQRGARGEGYPPEERLALTEAAEVMRKAIELDPYTPELFNMMSAWNYLLGRYDESIKAAGEAVRLRPYNYPNPHFNKAKSLDALGRREEALDSARESLAQASGGDFGKDAYLAKQLIQELNQSRQAPDFESIREQIIKGAEALGDEAAAEARVGIDDFKKSLLARIKKVKGRWCYEYIRIMSEMLIYFSTELVFCVLRAAHKENRDVPEDCLYAALYLEAFADGVIRKDAARLINLMILGFTQSRNEYRRIVLETSAASAGSMAKAADELKNDLARLNTYLPSLIADQEPVDDKGRKRAQKTILKRFEALEA